MTCVGCVDATLNPSLPSEIPCFTWKHSEAHDSHSDPLGHPQDLPECKNTKLCKILC